MKENRLPIAFCDGYILIGDETNGMLFSAKETYFIADGKRISFEEAFEMEAQMEYKPVIKAVWEPYPDVPGYLRCSNCRDCYVYGEWVNEKKWNYCPKCGAEFVKDGAAK